MIHENQIIFKKLVRSDSKKEFYYQKTFLKVFFFVNFKFFHKIKKNIFQRSDFYDYHHKVKFENKCLKRGEAKLA